MNWKKLLHLDEIFLDEEELEYLTDEEQKELKTKKINNLFIEPKTQFVDRNKIIVGNHETIIEISNQIDWAKFLPSYIAHQATFELFDPFEDKKLKDYHKKGLPAITLRDAVENFKFPPQHPQNGVAYAACSIEKDFYYPMACFHDYILDKKKSALIELCANLNAKEVKITSFEQDGKIYKGESMLSKIPTKVGNIDIESQIKKEKNTDHLSIVLYRFSKPKKEMKFYDNPWIDATPSWSTLRKIRLERELNYYETQLDFSEDFGIDFKLSTKLKNMGIKLGGEIKKTKKCKYNLMIEFW